MKVAPLDQLAYRRGLFLDVHQVRRPVAVYDIGQVVDLPWPIIAARPCSSLATGRIPVKTTIVPIQKSFERVYNREDWSPHTYLV